MGSFAFHGLVICENYVHVWLCGGVWTLGLLLRSGHEVLGGGIGPHRVHALAAIGSA